LDRAIKATKHKATTKNNQQDTHKARQHRVNCNPSTRERNIGKLSPPPFYSQIQLNQTPKVENLQTNYCLPGAFCSRMFQFGVSFLKQT
jgi:hypothetical protein